MEYFVEVSNKATGETLAAQMFTEFDVKRFMSELNSAYWTKTEPRDEEEDE